MAELPSETPVVAETSYGCQKQIIELYTYDYGGKGFLETRSVRLPTVAIRSGAVSPESVLLLVVQPHRQFSGINSYLISVVILLLFLHTRSPSAIHRRILLHLGLDPGTPPGPAVRLPDRFVPRRSHPRHPRPLRLAHQDGRQEHRLRPVHAGGGSHREGKQDHQSPRDEHHPEADPAGVVSGPSKQTYSRWRW